MKRLAIFIGGLLVLPAFAEVAPIFIDEENALEYTDAMYDENGFLIIPDAEVVEEVEETAAQKTQTPVKISRAPVNATPVANRSTATRATPTASRTNTSGRGNATGNSSRVVAARTTTNTSARGNTSRAVASRGAVATSPRTTTTAATSSTRATTNTAATRAAAARATGGSARSTTATVSGTGVARTATTAGRSTTASRAGTARTATTTTAARAATTTTGAARPSVRTNQVVAGVKDNQIGTTLTLGTVTNDGVLYKESKAASIRRTPTLRMSTLNSTSTDANSISMSMEDMDDLAEMTDYCKAQYANCMDNYCNVLDDNQGRCSCSANLKNYAKAEAALKTATEELQDVAQKIQYIGLTTREVETLFTQTEAELAMQSKTDSSQLQASLNKVKDMIVEVKTGTATSDTNTGLSFDLSGLLEFSFDSTGFDLMSLFGTSNTGSVSNQRGEELYKTASSRCKTSVIKACTARGVDASLITNAYDLEIDRECIMYERSLNDSNDEMLATVRNAKNVLQKARLMVAQQKNAYDMRGCINALDACMQDEFVCGSDYENCLDPTGRYIVNGEIVIGSQPGHAIDPELSNRVASVMTSDVCRVNLYRTWDFPGKTCREHGDADYLESGQTSPNYMSYPTYDQYNAWGSGTGDNLVAYIDETVTANAAKNASENMSQYLQNKIGYVNQKDGRAYGMCISVLNKCQDYTYTGKGTSAKYDPQNDVIKQYLGRVLVQIKSKQDEILANYAETCVSDVTSCLSQNGYPSEDPLSWDPSEYTTNITKMNIAINACRAQVVTCMSVNGYSIDTPTPTEMNCWVQGLLFNYTTEDCRDYHSSTISCGPGAYGLCKSEPTCKEAGGTWCDGYCYADASQCGSDDQYTVTINCGAGDYTPKASQSNVHTGQITRSINEAVISLDGLCSRDGYNISYWTCGGSSAHVTVAPQQTVTCQPTWTEAGSGNQTYAYSLTCGTGCKTLNTVNTGSVLQGNSVTVPNCTKRDIDIQTWTCTKPSGFSINATQSSFSMPGSVVVCNAECGQDPNIHVLTIDCRDGIFDGSKAAIGDENPEVYVETLYTHSGNFYSSIGQFSLKSGYCSSNGAEADKYLCGTNSTEYGNLPRTLYTEDSQITCVAHYPSDDENVHSIGLNCSSCGGSDSIVVSNVEESANVQLGIGKYSCGIVSAENPEWTCESAAKTAVSVSGDIVAMPSYNINCTATCYGGGSSGHTFTASCGNCISRNKPSATILSGNTVYLSEYCTAPSGGSINWNCDNNSVGSNYTVTMPDANLACSATCNGGSGNEQYVNLTIDCIDGTVNVPSGYEVIGGQNNTHRKTIKLTQMNDSNSSIGQAGRFPLTAGLCSKSGDSVTAWHLKGEANASLPSNTSALDWEGWQRTQTASQNLQNTIDRTVAPVYNSTTTPTVVKVDCGSRATIANSSAFGGYGSSGQFQGNTFTINPFNGATFSLDKAYCDCGTNKTVSGWTQFIGNNATQTIGDLNAQDVSITQNTTNTFTPICMNDSENLANNIYQCPPESGLTLNENVLNEYVQANGYTDSIYDATSGTYSFTSPAGQIAAAPANACICANGNGVGEWVVSSKQVTRGRANSYKPGVEKVTMEAGHTYTFHADCDDDDDEEDCNVTFQPGANCPAGQSATIVSCDTSKIDAPQFFENFGAQTWSCNPSNVISNLSELNEQDEYGISHGTGSVSLSGNSGTCTASCTPAGYVDIACGEGTLKTNTTPHIYPSTDFQGTDNYPPTAHVLDPIEYCYAPNGKEQYQWNCISNFDGGSGTTTINGSGWTDVSVYPGEQITCTAEWKKVAQQYYTGIEMGNDVSF